MKTEHWALIVISGLTLLVGVYITHKMIEATAQAKPRSIDDLLKEAQGG